MQQLLHRIIWQRLLSRRLRRKLLIEATRLMAPRPDKAPQPSERFIIAGYLRACSGLGESARLCYRALSDAGADVSAIDLSRALMQDQDRADFEFVEASRSVGAGTIILHVNAPWVPLAMLLLGRRIIRGKRIIGYWHWELPELPPEWTAGFRFVHEIWVPSRFTANAVARSMPGKSVRIIPHPVALRACALPARSQQAGKPFTVLVVFNMASSIARKNPFAAIEAFRAAFGDDMSARLILKTTNCESYPPGLEALKAATRGAANIEIVTPSFSLEQMDALYRDSDVVVSLHRSEGFGFAIAEAMLHGLPVIATDWSGNRDFLNAANGVPIRWTTAPAADPQGEYDRPGVSWADADIQEASASLRALRSNPSLRARLGRQAREDAAQLFSIERYRAAIDEALAS
jgi:glycosyltransferase involved in cell wall biosynthesis